MLCPRKSNILTWLCAFNRSQRAVSPLFSHESNSTFKFSVLLLLLPRQFSHLKFVSVVRRSAGLDKNENVRTVFCAAICRWTFSKHRMECAEKRGASSCELCVGSFSVRCRWASCKEDSINDIFRTEPADLRNNEFCRQPKIDLQFILTKKYVKIVIKTSI